jgi:hypothetical protein
MQRSRNYLTCHWNRRTINEAALGKLRKTFIYYSSPATGSFDQFVAKIRNDAAWQFFEMKNGHDAMVIDPESLAKALLQTI